MKTIRKMLFSGSLVFLGFFNSQAQGVSYDILTDDAAEIKHVVNFNLLDFDLGLYNLSGSSLNLALWGHNQLFPKFFLEYKVRVGYISWATAINKVKNIGLKPLQNYEVGANYDFFIGKKSKSHKYKMVLESRRFGSYTETKYFYAPGISRMKIGVRAGAKADLNQYRKNAGALKNFSPASGAIQDTYFNHFGFGFYAGISFKKLRNLIVDVDGYGLRSNSLRQNWIIDMLITPVNTFKNKVGGDQTVQVKGYQTKNLPIGFRIGYELQNTALRKEGGKLLPESSQFFIGFRPYDGWFFQYGVGWSLWRGK